MEHEDCAGARRLEQYPIHLGRGASAVPQPEFPRDERAMAWYMDYGARHEPDGTDGRLVSLFRFTEDWAGWEMHPAGAEVVVCLDGSMTLIQQQPDGEARRTTLAAGEYAINPPGVWHTADVSQEASGLFITAGAGTQNRPR
ncbi:MAG: cupin [Croceibacterium sp.]